jgi:hypothetical protein
MQAPGPLCAPDLNSPLNYIIRRLLIALPSLLGISLVLFTVLALAPGDPFEELATNPNVPPEVRMALRAQFGLDDPIWQRYFQLALGHAAGRLGLLLRQPHQRGHADPAAPAHHRGDRPVAGAGPAGGAAGGCAGRRQALFAGSTASPARWPSSASRCRPSSPACCSSCCFSMQLGWLPFVYRADLSETGWPGGGAVQAVDHADHGARAVPGGQLDALCALGRAGRDPAGLRHHRPQQGPGASGRSSTSTWCATR